MASLRVAMADHVGDPLWRTLVSRLRGASPEFAELWDRTRSSALAEQAGRDRPAGHREMRYGVSR